jgi:hypothetical protein
MKHIQLLSFICMLAATASFVGCGDKPPMDPGAGKDLTNIPYNPQAYTIKKPAHFPEIPVPADNPMTYDGVQLGRRLFYDPLLSANNRKVLVMVKKYRRVLMVSPVRAVLWCSLMWPTMNFYFGMAALGRSKNRH